MPQASPLPARHKALALALLLAAASGCVSAGGAAPKFLAPSRPAEFSMRGIPWNISRDSVTALIEPRGYNYNSTDEDGDMWFDGMLMNVPTRVFAFMAKDSLVKLRVRMITKDEEALSTYDKAYAELVRLYGKPSQEAREFEAPFARGRNEMEAVRQRKATINAHWIIGSGRRQSHVAIYMIPELVVVVDYEAPTWNAEDLRRRKAAN